MKRKKAQNSKKPCKRFAPSEEVLCTPEITSNELLQSSGSLEDSNLNLPQISDVTTSVACTSGDVAVKSAEPITVNEQLETSHLLENVQFKKPKRKNPKPIKNRISGDNVLKPTLNELFQNSSLLNNVKEKKPQKRNAKQSRSKASSSVEQFLQQTTVNNFFQSSLFGNQVNQSQKTSAKPQNKRSSNVKVPKRLEQAIKEPIHTNVLVANTKQKKPQKPRKKQPNSVKNLKPVVPSFKLPKLAGIDISLVPTGVKTLKQKVPKPLKNFITKLPKLSGVDISLVPANTRTSRPSVKPPKSVNFKPPKLSGVNISLVPTGVKTPRRSLKPPRQNFKSPQNCNVKPPNLSDVNISLVPKSIKTPRRNVKPPKKYADQDFIYYNKSEPEDSGVSPTNQTTSEDCGINPALLCECTLETAEASVSGHKRNVSTVSRDGDTSSENIECAPDVLSLCETAMVGPDTSVSGAKLQISASNTDTASEFEDDPPDLSNLCETVLITADPADALADNGQSVDSNHVTATDDENNEVGVSNMCESEVITPDTVSVTKPSKQPSSAVSGGLEVGSEDGFVDPSRMCESQLITSDPAEAAAAMSQLPVAGSSEEEFILGLNDELDFSSLRPNEVKDLQTDSDLKKEISVRKDKKNREPKKKSKKKKRSKSGSKRKKSKRKEKVQIENLTKVLTETLPANSNQKHVDQVEEEVSQGNGSLEKLLPAQRIDTEKPEDLLTDHEHTTSAVEEKLISKTDEENFCALEDKPVDDSYGEKVASVIENKVSNHDEENLSGADVKNEMAVPDKATVLNLENCEDSKKETLESLGDESLTESIKENPSDVEVKKEPEPNEENSFSLEEKPKHLVVGARNIDECSVPDSDSGCDVDMEQGCEDYESPGTSSSVKEETPAVDQVPSFNETRIVKVSLHRLEDEEYFSTWKEEKKLPKSLTTTLDTEPLIDDSENKETPTEPVLTVTKPKKSKRSRRATWDSIFKRKSFVKCTNCSKKFPNENLMKKHRGSHTCVVLVRCRRCFAKFKNVERYLEHKKSNCDTERVFACDVCGKSYALKLHLERHQNPICGLLRATTCEVCKLQFESRDSLRRHQHRAHGTGPHSREYLCEFCGALLTSKDKFQVHKETHIDLHCLCKECGKEFRSNRRLREHMKKHTKNVSERSSKADAFTCAECGESFSVLKKLKAHLAKHGMITALKSFECKICHKGFEKRENLSRHLRVHREAKDNICSNCNVSFNTFNDLKVHMTVCCVKLTLKIKSEDNLSIKEEKPYVCHVCGMSFKKSNYLKQHSVVHLYNKTLSTCEICGKTFKSKFYLDQHKLMVSCNVSSTNYCCKGCGNEYSTFPNLKMHFVEVHDVKPLGKAPIKCDKCQSEFDELYKLRRHSKIHKEGYWTSCKHCGKVITQRSLKSHILVAHGIQSDNDDANNVKVEPLETPVIKVEEQANLTSEVSNQNMFLKSNESAKPKLPSKNLGDKNLLPCRFCGKLLGSRRSLTRHILNVHKSSNISETSTSSTVPKTVPQHIKIEENLSGPQESFPTTSSTVSNESSMQRQTTEIKQIPVPCTICGKSLSSSRNLRRHMNACHKESTNNNTSPFSSKTNHTVLSDGIQQQFSHTDNDINSFSQGYEDVKTEITEPLNSCVGVKIGNESQMPTSFPRIEKSTLQSGQVYGSVQSSIGLRQSEQQIHDVPTSTQSQDYETPDISKDGILMSQLINAKNYKMYLPNTSFLNSQSQNIEANVRSNVPSNQEITSSYSLSIPSEAQQSNYPSPTNNPISVPVTYLSHGSSSTSFHSSTSCYSNPLTSYTSNSTISSSDQYINSTAITNLNIPSLLDDKQLDIIERMISTPPPVEAQVNATSSAVSYQQTLTPQYQNNDVPDTSSKYFLDPTYPALSKALTYPSSVTTEHTQTLPGQINEINGNNFQLVHQEAPVLTPSNQYMLHQYVQPNTSQSLTQMSYRSPGTTKTYIIVQQDVKPETVSKPQTVPSLNGYTKRVENWALQMNKNENQPRVLRVVCNLCKQSFDSKEDLNKHLVVHGLEYTSTHYRCTTCNHLFDHKYKYRAEEHLRIHSGEKPFACKQCTLKFRTSSLLSRHLQTAHKPAEKCSMCHVTLSSAYNLRRHMKSVHKIDDPPIQQNPEPVKEECPPSTQQVTELVKKESSASLLEMDFGPFQFQEKLANQSEPEPIADSQPNYQESFSSQEMPHFRRNEELSSNTFLYNFEAPSSSRSDVALDLSDMRDDYVPDAMETVLKLEHW